MLATKLCKVGSARGFVISKVLLKLLDFNEAGLPVQLHINYHKRRIVLTSQEHTYPLTQIDDTYDVKLIHLGTSIAVIIPQKVLRLMQLDGTGQHFKIDIDTQHGELIYQYIADNEK